MTRNLLAILVLLPLAFTVGCEDSSNGGNGGEADADTDADSDSDTDADFSATIVATIPFEGVQVTVDGTNAECAGTSCALDVDKPGEFQVSWSEGGCTSDSQWAGDGPCDEWTPGEYGMVLFEGQRNCEDEIWGREAEIEFVVTDEAITIKGISSSYESTMSGNNFYWSHSSGGWAAGIITDDGGLHVYQLNMVNGGIDEFLFYCD